MNKKIILCADDFGMSAPICQGILSLLDRQRLSAVSCMTNYPCWKKFAPKLKNFPQQADIGLHFNLRLPLQQLICQTYMGQLKRQELIAELTRQYDEFYQVLGAYPDFIDGHQHIQALPIIRDVITDFCKHNLPQAPIRITKTPQKSFKAYIINLLGAEQLLEICNSKGICHNRDLLGIYQFSRAHLYANKFAYFLRHSQTGSLIMCHPGEFAVSEPFREQEMNYFLSAEFIDALHRHNIVLARFTQLASSNL